MKDQNDFLPIIFLIKKNQIHYTIKSKWLTSRLEIPTLNIYIDKYYFGSYYYIYVNNKFVKKIKQNDFQDKIKIDFLQ